MKDLKIYLSIATALLVVYLVAQYNKPSPINWSPTLYYNDKIPFGTYVVFHELKQLFPGADIKKTNASIYTTLSDTTIMPGNYLVIAKTADVNKYDFNAMLKYIKAGNAVFISGFNIKGFLADTLKLALAYEYKKGNATLNFTNSKLKQPQNYLFSHDITNQYFSRFDTAKATVLSMNNFGHSTFLSFKFGRGNLYLCSNPGIFTNYSLLNNRGADYAAKTLSYLPASGNVYWDEFQNGDANEEDSPMRVFFSHPSLQWAYYISLFGICVFVLFEVKRRQRIIPVIEPLKNSTLDFVNVVGQVYYEKRNNTNIAHKKILYLFAYLRDEYQLKTNKLDNEFIEKLTAKLGIDAQFARSLVSFINYINVQQRITDHELIELNHLIEQLYTQTR
jgi:hypothetical protein